MPCTSPCNRCLNVCGRIKSTQNSRHAHYPDTTECDPNAQTVERTFCFIAKAMHDFKRSQDKSHLSMRVLCNHDIVAQRDLCNLATFTVIERFISFNFHALPIVYVFSNGYFCHVIFSTNGLT